MQEKDVIVPSNYEELDGSNEIATMIKDEDQKSIMEQIGDDLPSKKDVNLPNNILSNFLEPDDESNNNEEIIPLNNKQNDTVELVSVENTSIESNELKEEIDEEETKQLEKNETIVSEIAAPEHVETKEENSSIVEIPKWDLEPPFDAVDRGDI